MTAPASRLGFLLQQRLAVMLPLGFASGLPLALTAGTLQAWLTAEGVELKTIGLFTLVGLPYTLKFLWAPVIDRIVPPWLGRRRGWMVATQLCVAIALVLMAVTNPRLQPERLAALALLVAFLSASLDIVFDAYRTETLEPRERGLGAAIWVNGYRLALLVAGAGSFLLADWIGWSMTYLTMAAIMAAGLSAVIVSPEPTVTADPPRSLAEAVGAPLSEFFGRPQALAFLAVIVLYKLGDAFASSLQTAFLLGGMGFSATEVGSVKGMGIAATLLGALIGGLMMTKRPLVHSLLAFGVLQALSNLGFVLLALVGKSTVMLLAAVVIENLTGGMGTAAFVALVMSLCDPRYTATQFALLSSLEALGRVFAGRPSADLVEAVGWAQFFFWTFIIALPGLWVVWRLRARLPAAQGEALALHQTA
ncbi:AmpG family muropeptide MFS transporter [Nitrospira moscoviensis]|uniref:Muropeptide MFS transporter AmpG n=1 Tax=Nitrospira moscoviensis TaxID=42253 RepID=A0A0K2GCP8_NITMO|nr:MFS transporter [Nitrospira moscoviensis]ALA58723.1 Muropeptide MFS transporter AmpG [Nitrospira moscoviensis]